LTRLFIPLLIVFNIAIHFSSMSGIIIATALLSGQFIIAVQR